MYIQIAIDRSLERSIDTPAAAPMSQEVGSPAPAAQRPRCPPAAQSPYQRKAPSWTDSNCGFSRGLGFLWVYRVLNSGFSCKRI